MTMRHSHEEMKEFVAAYVLGALPEDEAFLARTHILSCDKCIAEAEVYQEVVSSLSLAADDAAPAPDLADRILRAATADEASGETQRVRTRRGSRLSMRAAVAVLAALLVLGGMSVILIQLNNRVQRDERILTALLHSDEGVLDLRGERGAVARILPTESAAFLVAAGLEEAPRNHVYQLWLMRGGEPVSAGIFDGSDAISLIELDVSLEGYEGAAITIEPAGGSARPTTEPILATR